MNSVSQTRSIMGMSVTVELVGDQLTEAELEPTFAYFVCVDNRFSTYKKTSEISQINRGEIAPSDYSDEMKEVFRLAKETKQETDGYFNIETNSRDFRGQQPDDIGPIGQCDPSGIVKGWAINNAAKQLSKRGYRNFFVDAGGDIATSGSNRYGQRWRVGIRNPFNLAQNVKIVSLTDGGIATSGNYERGEHIYNPKDSWKKVNAVASITVIGPDVYEADRFATAAFVMGAAGINFIEERSGLEGYIIDNDGRATMTTGFERYVLAPAGAKQ